MDKLKQISIALNKLNYGFFLSIILMVSFILLFSSLDKIASSYTVKDLEISQTKLIEDQSKYKHMIGIVHNIGNKTANQIVITANFFDDSKKSIGNFSKQTELRALNPDEITPFDILILDPKKSEKIHNNTMELKYNFTDPKAKKLDIVSNDSRLDMTGFFFVNGKIKNTGGSDSNNTNIISILYNKDRELIGVWKAQTEPYNIPPLATASFTIPITDKTQSFQISSYTLLTDSDNYSGLN
jgi:hypothetical protein